MTPGADETKLNFAWMTKKDSKNAATPVVLFGTSKKNLKKFTGTVENADSKLIGGPTRKTICATIGTTAGVMMAGISARLFGAAAGLSGWNVSNIESLLDLWYTCDIQVGELLFSGLLISSLGAVMDVAMSVSSARWMRWCVRTRQSQEESCFMQGIGGSFGVVLCVPITVLIASLLLRAPLKNNPAQ